MRVYVAGPMRGYPEFNARAFRAAAARLRAAGHEAYSPVERNDVAGFDPSGMAGTDEEMAAAGFNLRAAMAEELIWIVRHADALVVLPGWMHSKGAVAEVGVARALAVPVHELDELCPAVRGGAA